VGALIALYDRAVGFYGFLVNINAYHQPGVEAGKKAAAAILDLQKRTMQQLKEEQAPISLSDLAQKLGASDQIEPIYKLLRHLASNKRGVVLEGNMGQPRSLMVSAN
jgi:glucose-6-phosphate isomerase